MSAIPSTGNVNQAVPAAAALVVTTVDYHTAGEPFRIVTGGVGPIPGDTILDKRRYAGENLDHIRELVINEPRGHADMYGCFVTEPTGEDSALGVLFFHNAGYSTACGHGTIALATAALELGMLPTEEPETKLTLDVPSGSLPVVVSVSKGRVLGARFRNVPAFVHAAGIAVETSRGTLTADVSYGGAFYVSVAVEQTGLAVEPEHLATLIDLGREVKHRLERTGPIAHPNEPELGGVYGVIFFQPESVDPLTQRNVAIFADGEVDRSPCGSGTSARLALLHRSGDLKLGERFVHRSIIGTEFEARVVEETEVEGTPAVVTEVSGSAYRTGKHEFVLEQGDPLGTGFLLR